MTITPEISPALTDSELRQLAGGLDGREHLVVVGNGMAGARAVEELLARDGAARFRITMIGEEPYGNYNRILLSEVLSGDTEADGIFLNPLGWYREHGIQLRCGVRATRIDRAARAVELADGSRVTYDKLLLATGSRPSVPPIAGMDPQHPKPGLFWFRSIDDCRRIRAHAEGGRAAAVIGGGLLGLEAAHSLRRQGLEVHVIQRAAHLMNVQLDRAAGRVLRQQVERAGVHVRTGCVTTRLLGEGQVTGLAFADGTELACDMVVVATGITPNVELAQEAGLTVERGIVVDDQLRTVEDPAVFALGECAQHRGATYGLVAPLWEQATVWAEHLSGADPGRAYHGSKVATKLKVAGIDLATMGLSEPEDDADEQVVFAEPRRGVYQSVIVRDGKLVGATLLGDTSRVAFLQQALDRGTPLPEERARLLFDLDADGGRAGVAELPDDSQICNCNGVCKQQLTDAVRAGHTSAGAVMRATRAGTACGSCKPLVAQVVEWAAGDALTDDESAHWYVPGVPLRKPELVAEIRGRGLKSVSAVWAALTGGVEDPASKPGLASLLKSVWGEEYVDERDARFINDRVHANIQKDGTFSVVPRMAGGVTNPEQLRRIADVAEKYQVPMVKLTGGQRIDLLGVRKEDLPSVWRDLGMTSGSAYGKKFRTCKSCVGTDFCRFGLGDSIRMGIAVEERLKGLEMPAKVKMAASGCPRNCAESLSKDVGIVAIEGGRWEVYVGGAGGSKIRKGDLLCTVDTQEEVLRHAGRFLQYYIEHARYLERTYDFVERVGIEELRAVIVDDRDGLGERLDAALQESLDGYYDPWTVEAAAPVTANQFRERLPVVAG